MFKLKLDVVRLRCGRAAAGGAAMKSIHCSILTRLLMTGVSSLAFVMVSAGGVRADIVTVQGANGAAGSDASNTGNDAQSGGDGESVSANAGSTQPITAPQNQPSQEAAAVARAATAFLAIPLVKAAVLAEMAALRTPRHSRPSSLARREWKPVPKAGAGAGAELLQ
jgi:hypothetical protein